MFVLTMFILITDLSSSVPQNNDSLANSNLTTFMVIILMMLTPVLFVSITYINTRFALLVRKP